MSQEDLPYRMGFSAMNTNIIGEDLEAQKPVSSSVSIEESLSSEECQNPELSNNSNVPHLPPLKLFWFFFCNFGLFAWGGPVAQIALIKEELVVKDKWITMGRFKRVISVYQVLHGPEATKLCMFFGCLSGGKLGGLVAGLAFILPGLTIVIIASYLYSLAGIVNI